MFLLNKVLSNFIVYAAETDYTLESSGLKEVLLLLTGISTALAVVAAGVSLIRYMSAGEGQALSAAKDDLKTILLCWIAINSLGLIIRLGLTLIQGVEV